MGGLERDGGGLVVDLAREATHHPGQADGASVVGDDEVVGREGARHVVERLERLAGRRGTRSHGPAQLGEVEGVQRLAGLEHHVVGDVDCQRHRAHARGH